MKMRKMGQPNKHLRKVLTVLRHESGPYEDVDDSFAQIQCAEAGATISLV